nr:putative reverse transcriptase domain-containing protein [Tanacetum cinerariifolium]
LTGLKLIRDMTEKIVQIKNRLLTARSYQKSYANKRAKSLEFKVGDMVLLKVSLWKGDVRFGKREKLSPCYIGPFKILAGVGPIEGDIVVPVDEIQLDDKLHMIEETVEVIDREVKRLNQSWIPIVEVHWNSQRGPEFTWEREDQIKKSTLISLQIIMVNVIPPDHVDDVPVVELNQHADVPVVLEPVLEDEDEDPEEEEFKEEEDDPQEEEEEEEDDMEVDIKEDENKPELTYPYEEDETFPASVYEVGESSTAPYLPKDSDGLLPSLMRRDINSLFGRMASFTRRLCGRETAHALVKTKEKAKDKYYGKLILDLGNEVCSSVEQGTNAMENLVEKLGSAEDKVECKMLKKELEEARGFMFKERPNEAINVPIKDEKSPSSESQRSPHDS